MTVVGGSELAKEITDEHEEWNMAHGQEPIDLAMDLINNEVGREIARGGVSRTWLFAPKLLRDYLIKLTALAISEGKLVEIRKVVLCQLTTNGDQLFETGESPLGPTARNNSLPLDTLPMSEVFEDHEEWEWASANCETTRVPALPQKFYSNQQGSLNYRMQK